MWWSGDRAVEGRSGEMGKPHSGERRGKSWGQRGCVPSIARATCSKWPLQTANESEANIFGIFSPIQGRFLPNIGQPNPIPALQVRLSSHVIPPRSLEHVQGLQPGDPLILSPQVVPRAGGEWHRAGTMTLLFHPQRARQGPQLL